MGQRLDRRPPASAPEPKGFRKALLLVEKVAKEKAFDCRMCGQCILHSTGMSCPMRCPKNLRNGPCGGVLQDGTCEVLPDRPCVWVQALEGARALPIWRDHLDRVNPPVDWRLQETASWENGLTGRDKLVPAAWRVRPETPAAAPAWAHPHPDAEGPA
ncbi:MAG: methylenetetrahydrofolate reductase C-terminal domain-containing protein [Actinomycetota bacterium]